MTDAMHDLLQIVDQHPFSSIIYRLQDTIDLIDEHHNQYDIRSDYMRLSGDTSNAKSFDEQAEFLKTAYRTLLFLFDAPSNMSSIGYNPRPSNELILTIMKNIKYHAIDTKRINPKIAPLRIEIADKIIRDIHNDANWVRELPDALH